MHDSHAQTYSRGMNIHCVSAVLHDACGVDLFGTLPGVAPRSAIFTDVRDVFGIWDSLAP